MLLAGAGKTSQDQEYQQNTNRRRTATGLAMHIPAFELMVFIWKHQLLQCLSCTTARNHLPSQGSLGQVEAATKTELPIRKAAAQVKVCEGCTPHSWLEKGASSTYTR